MLNYKKKRKNSKNKKRIITVREFSAYSNSNRPWYSRKETMTLKEFNKRKRNYRYKEMTETGRGKYPNASWKKKYLEELHD